MRARLARVAVAAAFLIVVAVPARAAEPDLHRCTTVLVAFPVGTSSCPGVRPGAMYFRTSDGARCSMSFLFRGSDGRDYAASAGHCIWTESNITPAPNKEEKWDPGAGMAVVDRDDKTLGRFAYGAWTEDRDFSLIRLDPGVQPSAAMCYFGGPAGMYKTHASDPIVLKFFGNGNVIGALLPARSAVAEDTSDRFFVYAFTASAPGDSGSAVITAAGPALGTLVGLNLLGGETIITRLDESIRRAEAFTGIRFSLQTAAVTPDAIRL